MSPPPIRYPLPSLILLLLVGILVWRGADWIDAGRVALARRWETAIGPSIPQSGTPQRRPDGITRRVLLLDDGTAASESPGGPPVETIRFRLIADVYDVWPLAGDPTHYRIGTRRPIGWVEAAKVLPWDTRLAIRPPAGGLRLASDTERNAFEDVPVGGEPLPVIGWTSEAVQVATWEPGAPWAAVARIGWLANEQVEAADWSVWLSRDELLAAIGRSTEPGMKGGSPTDLRLTAILGRLGSGPLISEPEAEKSLAALPPPVRQIGRPERDSAAEALARINEGWEPDASWSGLTFRAIPLAELP